VAETGNKRAPAVLKGGYFRRRGSRDRAPIICPSFAFVKPLCHRLVKLDTLFAGAAVDIAKYVDCRGHGVVDADTASDCHARDRNGRRLGPWSTAATRAASESFACAGLGSSPRVINQTMSAKPTRPISSSMA